MDGLRDDEAARLERLDRWGESQRALAEPWKRLRWRDRPRQFVKRALDVGLDATGRVLDKGLNTADYATEPEHDDPDHNFYLPTPWYVLPRALRYLGVSDRDTFVDFGCGKGRVVHQAAKRPFRRVIGVEISPALAEAARAGLAARRYRCRCPNVEIVVCDVTQFQIPDDLTIGYFFHPFKGEKFDAVLRNIVDSIDRHPRHVSLIYVHPQLSAQVLATGRFRLVKELPGGLPGKPDHLSRAAIFASTGVDD